MSAVQGNFLVGILGFPTSVPLWLWGVGQLLLFFLALPYLKYHTQVLLTYQQTCIPRSRPLSALVDKSVWGSLSFFMNTVLAVGLCRPSLDIDLMLPIHHL